MKQLAFAKVNLILSVSAPLPPGNEKAGFHHIASWFSCIDLCDELVFSHAAEASLTVRWAQDAPKQTPIDWPTAMDLTHRAHRLLEQHSGRQLGAHIELAKRIPVGGGLGGGSADAAAALVGLNRMFELGLSVERLRSLATKLGSDVPFFIPDSDSHVSEPAFVGGFGERIERCRGFECDLLLIIPPFGCPTGPVYRAFDEIIASSDRSPIADEQSVRSIMASMFGAGATAAPAVLFNDLAAAACRVEPRLGALVQGLSRAIGLPVHITGSGSCAFVLCQPGTRGSLLQQARKALADIEPRAVVVTTRTCGGATCPGTP